MKNITLSLFAFTFLSYQSASAQADWKSWNAVNLTVSPTKKLDFRLSHLRSYELNNHFNNDFNQSSVQAEYNFTRRFAILGGFMLTQFPASANTTRREYLRVLYKQPVLRIINFTTGVQGEVHSAEERRFKNRVISISRIGLQKRLPFLHLAPSVSYWLYYNIGGQPIQYYDQSGNKLVKQTPDGFHRGRLFLNLNSKINRFFSVNLYYVQQKEFNLFTDALHTINVKNPSTGKITRRFDSYNVAGISLAIDLDLYKKN